MATRLVRKLCQSCREAYTPTKQDLKTLGRLAEKIDGRKLYRAGPGCEQCFNQCYRDRLGIHETAGHRRRNAANDYRASRCENYQESCARQRYVDLA